MDRVTLENGQPTVQYEPAETMNTENPTFFFFFFFFSWLFVITSFAVSDTLYMLWGSGDLFSSFSRHIGPAPSHERPERSVVFYTVIKAFAGPVLFRAIAGKYLPTSIPCYSITRTFPSCSWKLFLLCFHAIAGIFPIFNWP